jgi:hypothetical protein
VVETHIFPLELPLNEQRIHRVDKLFGIWYKEREIFHLYLASLTPRVGAFNIEESIHSISI